MCRLFGLGFGPGYTKGPFSVCFSQGRMLKSTVYEESLTTNRTPIYELPCYAVRDGSVWVAICLPLGIPSQSSSLLDAMNLLVECVTETIGNLAARGLDPLRTWEPSPEALKQYNDLSSRPRVQIDVTAVPNNISAVVFDLAVGNPEQNNLDRVTAPLAMAC